MLLFAYTLIATVATLEIVPVFAQSLFSSQCQSTLTSIASSSDAQCLNTAGLVQLFSSGSADAIVPGINTWLTGMCSKSACSNQTLAKLVTDVANGCSSDLSSLGLDVQDITTAVQQFYPTVRQILCLHDNSANQLCAVEGLYVVQNQTGSLSIDNISTDVLPSVFSEQDVACSACSKAAFNIVLSNDPEFITSSVNSSILDQCGANFLDGKPPAGITQTAVGNGPSSGKSAGKNNGALGSLAVWDGLANLAGLGVILTVLL